MKQLYSNCCHAEMRLDYAKDICPACQEGCGVEEEEEEEDCDVCTWKPSVSPMSIDSEHTMTCPGCGKWRSRSLIPIERGGRKLPTQPHEASQNSEPYQPRVGDHASDDEEFKAMLADMLDSVSQSVKKLNAALDEALARLSRKPPRTLTKAEAEALLTEKLGESVRIEN